MQNTPCPHCSGFHILGSLSGHVKSAHPLANFVSQASQAIFFLQVSSLPVIFLGSIPLAS